MRRDEKKDLKTKIFIGVVGFFMLLSFIGLTVSSLTFQLASPQSNEFKYNGKTFVATEQGLQTTIEDQNLLFNFFPEDVRTIDLDPAIIQSLDRPIVQFTVDPNDPFITRVADAQFDISKTLERQSAATTEIGFTTENQFNREIITCSDSSDSTPVLFFNFTNTTSEFRQAGSCIVVNYASEVDLAKMRDRLVYSLIGVE